MKKIYAIFILFFVLCACTTGQKKNEIVVCGDDKVWIVNVDNSEGKNLDIVWKWNAQESNIPDDFKKYFQGMDECKTAKNGDGPKWKLDTYVLFGRRSSYYRTLI